MSTETLPVIVNSVVPQPTKGVLSLSPYVQGKGELEGIERPLKLSSNESMSGPSPKAKEVYAAMVADNTLSRYPDGSQQTLRGAIGDVFGFNPEQIVCGNGSDELIQLVMRAYLNPGDEVVVSKFSFGMVYVHAASIGAVAVTADEPNLKPDTDELLSKVTTKTKMVVLASPNNPVGQYISRDELLRLRDSLPPHVILLCDSAYADYVSADDFEDGSNLVSAGENTIMTRTFSKLYGLAALRIGWMYAPVGIIDVVQRIRTPFNANAAALAAATEAMLDQTYAQKMQEINATELQRISEGVKAIGIEFIPSVANFYLLRFDGLNKTAQGAAAFLEENGIIPRPVNAGGPEHCLRITVGLPEQNDRVITTLNAYMAL